MPYRQPLDIEDYIDALGEESELQHVMELAPGFLNSGPRLWGDGPVTASTSTDLARTDDLVWDANGYYRELGFPSGADMVLGGYREITRRDILRAVKAQGVELRNTRQTYCVKQLLDRETRRSYNAMASGEFYFDDEWEAYFKAQAEAEVADLQKRGMDISVEDILERWGLAMSQEPTTDEEPEDDGISYEKPSPNEGQQLRRIESDWDWSFYVWDATQVNLSWMENWQSLLTKALRQNYRMGYRYADLNEFAVGVMGFGKNPDCPRTRIYDSGEHYIFFLRSDVEPTKKMAQETIRTAIRENHVEVKVRG